VYSSRYIPDRFLPDKAIDLVDEAAASLRLAQESKPDELQALDRAIVTLQIELESLKNESDVFSVERREKVEANLREKREDSARLSAIWQAGKEAVAWMITINLLLQNVTNFSELRISRVRSKKGYTNYLLLSGKVNSRKHLDLSSLHYQN
jgi:ATP-dependent Clp protease ATP-binding subunit ClpB